MSNNRSRLFLNVVKGLAIFLMLYGHCIQYCSVGSFDFYDNAVFKFIYSFHMPLFMLVSGYLFYFSFEKRDLKGLIAHRANPLIWTIIAGGILIWLMTTGLFNVVKGNYSAVFGGGWLPSLKGLWFLWSVLSASIGVAIICKKVKPIWLQILLLCLWGGVVLLFPNASQNLYMYPYYVIGFFFAKHKDQISKWVLAIKYASLPIYPIMLLFFEKKHYVGMPLDSILEAIGVSLFRCGIGLAGSVFVLTIVELIFFFLFNGREGALAKAEKALSLLGKVGENSLQIYVISVIFLSSYLPIVYNKAMAFIGHGNFLANNIWMYNLVWMLLLAIAYTVVLYFIVKVLYKIRIGKLIFSK